MKMTLGEIATLVNGRLAGDASLTVEGAANLENARETDVTFAVEPHIQEAKAVKAGAILLPEGTETFPIPAIYVEDPRAAFAKLLEAFTPPLSFPEGVSKLAYVGEGAKIAADAVVMPFAVLDAHAVVESGAVIYPHVYIGQYATIGEKTVVYSNATVREHCRVGKRAVIHSSAVVGSDGFGFTTKDGVHTKVPQVGNVVVEDDVEIGAHVGIDRATTGSTVIGRGTKIDNLVHIGHNCRIGANNIIVAQTGISGSTETGPNVTFGGQTGTVGHIKIGGNSLYAARSGIIGDMPEGYIGAGFPVQTHQEWLRMQSALRKLPALMKRVKQLEKKAEQLETQAKAEE